MPDAMQVPSSRHDRDRRRRRPEKSRHRHPLEKSCRHANRRVMKSRLNKITGQHEKNVRRG